MRLVLRGGLNREFEVGLEIRTQEELEAGLGFEVGV